MCLIAGFQPIRLQRQFCLLAVLLVFFIIGGIAPAVAQATATAQETALLEELKAKKAAVAADTSQDEKTKAKLLDLYEQAIQARKQTIKARADQAQLKSEVKTLPGRLQTIRRQLVKPSRRYDPVGKLPKGAGIDQVTNLLRQEEEQYNNLNTSLKKHTADLNQLLDAAAKLSDKMADRSSRKEKIDADLKAAPDPDEPPAITSARQEALLARKDLRVAELELYRLQMDNHELLTSLAAAERDLALRESNNLLPGLEALREVARQLREASAAKGVEEAERAKQEVLDLPGPIRVIAEKNVALSAELQDLTSNEAHVVERLDVAHRSLDDIKTEAESTRQRVEIVGLSEAVGRMLRKRAAALPSLESYRRDTRVRRAEINRITDRQIDIEELQRDLLDIESRVQEIIADIEGPGETAGLATIEMELTETEKNRLTEQARELLTAHRDSLLNLHQVYGRYISQLTALDRAERQLVTEAETFIAFIEERLIWIRSTGPVMFTDALHFISGTMWLVSPSGWIQVVKDFFASLQLDMSKSLLGLLGVAALLALRRYSVCQIKEIAGQTKKIRTDSFWLTLRTLWHTLVLAAGWPSLMLFVAWRLIIFPGASSYSLAMGEGLYDASALLATVGFFRHICRTEGLGDRHFRWPKQIRSGLLHNLIWLQVSLPILMFVITAAMASNQEAIVQGVGRPAFVVMMAVLVFFAMRILRASGPLQTYMREKGLEGELKKIRLLWLPVVILLPLVMTFGSALGYHYTALIVERHIQITIWFFLGLLVLRDLLLRALYIAERKFRYEEALKKREELRAQREKDTLAGDEDKLQPMAELPESDYVEVDYGQLSEQAKRLLHIGLFIGAALGLWAIWADLLPIFNVLDAVTLSFTTTEMVDGIEKVVPLTLADLILALLFIALTIIAAKNLPGLMEIALLQRLPLDAGARYAVTALSQYLIAAIGTVTAFNTIGVQWSSIQWLVAALSVGLGFGLQEIVANFISGIILLFEQPIRVGDTVTVGDATGKVFRIRIRATTIITWDKQELLVPNKEFITNRLLNWTLSDQTIRIMIPVGIAYGSDVDKALELMAEAAAESKYVLKDPEPQLTFDSFGDNALMLSLRCFLGSLEYRLDAITALHKEINHKFNKAGIAIAFPQRDIHLDTTKPLDIRLHNGSAGANQVLGN